MPAKQDADLPDDLQMDAAAVRIALLSSSMHHTLLGVRLRQASEGPVKPMTVGDFNDYLERLDAEVAANLFPPKR